MYVAWIRHSDYCAGEHVGVSVYRPRDYRNNYGTVTYDVLLETPDWRTAHDRVELERAYRENARKEGS